MKTNKKLQEVHMIISLVDCCDYGTILRTTGSIGLMDQVAQTVHVRGGHVLGVIPKALMGKETVGEVIAVNEMHQRKAEMPQLAEAFIALPGGYGTLEELLQVGLLNVDGYYNPLLALFEKALEEGLGAGVNTPLYNNLILRCLCFIRPVMTRFTMHSESRNLQGGPLFTGENAMTKPAFSMIRHTKNSFGVIWCN